MKRETCQGHGSQRLSAKFQRVRAAEVGSLSSSSGAPANRSMNGTQHPTPDVDVVDVGVGVAGSKAGADGADAPMSF
jgi:hypothetical protein